MIFIQDVSTVALTLHCSYLRQKSFDGGILIRGWSLKMESSQRVLLHLRDDVAVD